MTPSEKDRARARRFVNAHCLTLGFRSPNLSEEFAAVRAEGFADGLECGLASAQEAVRSEERDAIQRECEVSHLEAEERGRAEGRAEERAAVVEWFKAYAASQGTDPHPLWDEPQLGAPDAFAIGCAIEAGAHVKETP